MPIADMLVDAAANNGILSFTNGYSGYNQTYLAEEDVHKTAFCCPEAIDIFEWVVMPFDLKNARATYQRAMNLIFHDFIGQCIEVYINDKVVKSADFQNYLANLEQAFLLMRKHSLKMNPAKCAFRVSAGNFLSFLVHQKGIEANKNKVKAVLEARPQTNKKELQSLISKINFIKRLIANLVGKLKDFSPLLRLKQVEEFIWGSE